MSIKETTQTEAQFLQSYLNEYATLVWWWIVRCNQLIKQASSQRLLCWVILLLKSLHLPDTKSRETKYSSFFEDYSWRVQKILLQFSVFKNQMYIPIPVHTSQLNRWSPSSPIAFWCQTVFRAGSRSQPWSRSTQRTRLQPGSCRFGRTPWKSTCQPRDIIIKPAPGSVRSSGDKGLTLGFDCKFKPLQAMLHIVIWIAVVYTSFSRCSISKDK